MDFEKLKKIMIENHLIPRGVKDPKVLDAMAKVPRHKFLPPHLQSSAYDDRPLPIGNGQTISQPYMVAIMTEYLSIDKNSKILEIGTGSGYQTAILAEIGGEVYTIERIEELSLKAKSLLEELGYKNIKYKIGDGTIGWPEEAPFDSIIVTAASPTVPETYIEQLKDGGKIVIPTGGNFFQTLKVVEKRYNKIFEIDKFDCAFVPLIGKYGWKGSNFER